MRQASQENRETQKSSWTSKISQTSKTRYTCLENTWNHAKTVDSEEFFCDIIPAHGVLEGEVELVLGFGLEKEVR